MNPVPLHHRLPAEFEPQQATLLSWPANRQCWGHLLPFVQETYLSLIREIADHQEVWLNVSSPQQRVEVERLLTLYGIQGKNVHFFAIPAYDAWIRDYGPVYLLTHDGRRIMTDWLFNGWGAKYESEYFHDSEYPVQLATLTGEERRGIDFVLEGGSIETNGKGVILTTTNCLLNSNRPGLRTPQSVEEVLKRELGAEKILWLSASLEGDDTDGHIDNLARFVDPDTLVCLCADGKSGTHDAGVQQLHQNLTDQLVQNGLVCRVVKLPLPDPVFIEGRRMPASYANFLITSKKVLVPVYGGKKDEIALNILRELFPGRTVVPVDSRHLIYGLGSVHCLTMQVPAGKAWAKNNHEKNPCLPTRAV